MSADDFRRTLRPCRWCAIPTDPRELDHRDVCIPCDDEWHQGRSVWQRQADDGTGPEGSFRLIAPVARPQVDPAAPSDAAPESQGATGAGGSATPGPIEHTDPLPACPECGAQPGGCEHVTVEQRGESAKPGGVVLRRTVVTITYPWEDA